jgi:hypothetical protein
VQFWAARTEWFTPGVDSAVKYEVTGGAKRFYALSQGNRNRSCFSTFFFSRRR